MKTLNFEIQRNSSQWRIRVKQGQSKFALYWYIRKDEESIWTLTFLGRKGDEFRGIYTLPEIAVAAVAEWQSETPPHTGDKCTVRETREAANRPSCSFDDPDSPGRTTPKHETIRPVQS